jgi:hypothetical protein
MWNVRRDGSYPLTEEGRRQFVLKPEDKRDFTALFF